jgi:hypothetical protein
LTPNGRKERVVLGVGFTREGFSVPGGKGSFAAAAALAVALALLPAAAQAAPADNLTVYSVGGHLTANWRLPDGTDAEFIEVSIGQRVDGLGDYDPYLLSEFFSHHTTVTWTSSDTFPPGSYFLHVATSDAAQCAIDPNCRAEYAEQSVFVPGTPLAATPPILASVGHASRHLAAVWTKEATTDSDIVEAAGSSATYYPGGPFLATNLALFEYVNSPDDTSYVSTDKLAPGAYWVHVSSVPTLDSVKCPTGAEIACRIDEFSPAEEVTIPPYPASGDGGKGGSSGGWTGSKQPTSKPKPAAVDKSTAFATLNVTLTQDVDKLFVLASMAEAGTLTARGTIRVPRRSRVYKFKTASATAVPNVSVRLKLKLRKKALKAVKKALKRHRRLKAKVTITARDKAGNSKTAKRTVSLKP